MLLRFQILCIYFFLKKTLTLKENLLHFNKAYMGRKQPVVTATGSFRGKYQNLYLSNKTNLQTWLLSSFEVVLNVAPQFH